MAKRLTDTEKWERPWFRELSTTNKCLWLYILDKCDMVGLWHVDFKLASFLIGDRVDPVAAVKALGKQIVQVDGGAKWLISDFVRFQYGKNLNPRSAVHARVMSSMRGLVESHPALAEALAEPWPRPSPSPGRGPRPKDKDLNKANEKAKDKAKDKVKAFCSDAGFLAAARP